MREARLPDELNEYWTLGARKPNKVGLNREVYQSNKVISWFDQNLSYEIQLTGRSGTSSKIFRPLDCGKDAGRYTTSQLKVTAIIVVHATHRSYFYFESRKILGNAISLFCCQWSVIVLLCCRESCRRESAITPEFIWDVTRLVLWGLLRYLSYLLYRMPRVPCSIKLLSDC